MLSKGKKKNCENELDYISYMPPEFASENDDYNTNLDKFDEEYLYARKYLSLLFLVISNINKIY